MTTDRHTIPISALPVFFAMINSINCIVHHHLLKFSPSQQAASGGRNWCAYRGLVLGIHVSASCPDAVISRFSSRLLAGHMLGLTAQKLDFVTSTMCWCVVLEEDKHVPSNAVDRWQQLLRQQHVSILLSK